MKPFSANLMNGLVLLLMGVWGSIEAVMNSIAAGGTFSKTVFIAPVFGILFLILSNGFKSNNKVVVHVVVLLTLLVTLSMISPLLKREGLAQIRVGIMVLSGVVTTFFFIKNFIDVRKARVG